MTDAPYFRNAVLAAVLTVLVAKMLGGLGYSQNLVYDIYFYHQGAQERPGGRDAVDEACSWMPRSVCRTLTLVDTLSSFGCCLSSFDGLPRTDGMHESALSCGGRG